MFERFTEKARDVVTIAQSEARGFNHNYIGTEHLLLGLLSVEDSLSQVVLREIGVDIEYVREEIAGIVGRGDVMPIGQIPFTPRAKKILDLSLREALGLGHNYIGPEHLLLGLARENEGVASRILDGKEITAVSIRQKIAVHLSRSIPPRPRVPKSIRRKISALKDEALDAGFIELASRLRAIERDMT